MNLELFIARRLLGGGKGDSVSVPIVKIAVIGIALGLCVMLLSVFIIMGFKGEITDKLSGFTSHLDITSCDEDALYGGQGLMVTDSLLASLRNVENVKQAVCYVTKPAILKSDSGIHGVVLKGVDFLYDPSFYERHLNVGHWPALTGAKASAEILVSASVAGLLEVKVGDRIAAHFVQDPPRVRMFTIAGIYDTGFKEYDDMFVLCDMRHLQRLNGWTANEMTGVGVELADMRDIPQAEKAVDGILYSEETNACSRLTTLYDTAPQIFDWLNLLNMNVVIILTLIIAVAGFNMVSGLLILILDKTTLIGILKALGYRNLSLRRLFLYIAMGLIAKGMLVGNLLALGLGALQSRFQIISLDPEVYYMDTVPIDINVWAILLLNVGVLVIAVLMLMVPTILVSKISPIKAIRFE